MPDLTEWAKGREEKDNSLYEKFAEFYLAEHKGEYIAISDDEKIPTGKNSAELLEQAIREFGPGNFAFKRIGYPDRTFEI